MNDKYKEIGAGLAVIGSIVSALPCVRGPDRDFWRHRGELRRRDQGFGLVRRRRPVDHRSAGADPIGTGPREKYDALRKSLATHEDAKDGYARRLKAFLAKVDAFFGDTDVANQRFFLLREQAALWTAPAFDRCLLLALFYPVAAIFVIWAVSGEVGPAERALQLGAADGRDRLAAITATGVAIFALGRGSREGSRRWTWFAAGMVASAGAGASVGVGLGAVGVIVAAAVAVIVTGAVAAALAVTGPVAVIVTGAVAVTALALSLSLSLLALSLSLSLSLLLLLSLSLSRSQTPHPPNPLNQAGKTNSWPCSS